MDYSTSDAAATAALATFSVGYMIFCLALVVIILVGLWKIFQKAGEPGWAAIVPFYESYVLFKITFGNGWLFLLMFVPLVNVVVEIMCYHKLSKAFGHGVGYTLGLIFIPIVFVPMLGFGSSEYMGPQ